MDRIAKAVVVVSPCTSGVQETLAFNAYYLFGRILEFANLSLLGQRDVRLADIRDGNIRRTVQVNVLDTFSRQACMSFGYIFISKYLD